MVRKSRVFRDERARKLHDCFGRRIDAQSAVWQFTRWAWLAAKRTRMGEPLRRTISSTPNSEVTLAAQNVSGQAQEAHDAVKKVAEDLEASPLQVALAWLLKRSKVILPIPGTSSIKHLEENIAAASLELPQAAYDELSEVSLPAASLRG